MEDRPTRPRRVQPDHTSTAPTTTDGAKNCLSYYSLLYGSGSDTQKKATLLCEIGCGYGSMQAGAAGAKVTTMISHDLITFV